MSTILVKYSMHIFIFFAREVDALRSVYDRNNHYETLFNI